MARVLPLLICLLPAWSSGCRGRAEPPAQVVVYVAVDRNQAEPILASFERRTGIHVLAVYDAEAAKTTGLVTRLLAEAGRPVCDVFWNNEVVQTLLLADRGLLEPYVSPSAADVPAKLKDPDGLWTGVATRARVIVYNSRYVRAEDAPRSLNDLTDRRWRGKVAIANPQFGTSRTHAAALFAVQGPEQAQDFFRRLLDNNVRIVDGNAMVKNLVARAQPGASPVLVGLTDTDDVMAGQAEGEPLAMIYPDQDAAGTLVIPTSVCLLANAPHPDAARRLVDFLTGPDAEAQLTVAGTGYSPVRGAAPVAAVPGAAAQPVRGLPLDWTKLLEQLDPSSRWTAENFYPQ